MKKIITLFLALLTLFISSCSGVLSSETYKKQLEENYSVNATVIEDGVEYTVRIIHDNGKIDIVFAEPTALWGMGYSFDDEDSYLIYNDMSISLNESIADKDVNAGVYYWRRLLNADGDFAARYSEYEGQKCIVLEDSDRTIYFSEKDKSLIALKSKNTEIKFKDFESGQTNDTLQTENLGGN